MGLFHKTPGPRLAKLERLARTRPCSLCGRIDPPRDPNAPLPDPTRLSTAEQKELTELLAAGTTPVCARCGRFDCDFGRVPDNQLHRALDLLRKLMNREVPECPVVPFPELYESAQ